MITMRRRDRNHPQLGRGVSTMGPLRKLSVATTARELGSPAAVVCVRHRPPMHVR